MTSHLENLENLENLEKSGNSKVVREKSWKMEKVGEKSGQLKFESLKRAFSATKMCKIARLWGGFAPSTPTGALPWTPLGA